MYEYCGQYAIALDDYVSPSDAKCCRHYDKKGNTGEVILHKITEMEQAEQNCTDQN